MKIRLTLNATIPRNEVRKLEEQLRDEGREVSDHEIAELVRVLFSSDCLPVDLVNLKVRARIIAGIETARPALALA